MDELLPVVRDGLSAHLRSGSLRRAFSTTSSCCLMLLHVPSGLVVDVSDMFLSHGGWQRSDVAGRRMCQPLRVTADNSLTTSCTNSGVAEDTRVLVRGEDGRRVPNKDMVPQYENSMRLLHRLFTGVDDTIDALWRIQLGDGKMSAIEHRHSTAQTHSAVSLCSHTPPTLTALTHSVCLLWCTVMKIASTRGWLSGRIARERARRARRARRKSTSSLVTASV